MSDTLPPGVRVELLGPSARGSGPALVEGLLGSGSAVVHACARCGGSDHGRLVVRRPAGRWASVARAGDLTLVALSERGPVGVDVEAQENAGRVPTAVLDLRARGPAGDPGELLQRWCHVEAALKAFGTGLVVDADHVRLVAGRWAGSATLEVDDGAARPRASVHAIEVAGHRASVALLQAPDGSAGSSAR